MDDEDEEGELNGDELTSDVVTLIPYYMLSVHSLLYVVHHLRSALPD